ncbi:MAG TPA: peptidylprolyl isomerase, partial [Nannocystaceae bacterium]|nr:peptidylprolyl isomerase [Nannocystaceae bacterium]
EIQLRGNELSVPPVGTFNARIAVGDRKGPELARVQIASIRHPDQGIVAFTAQALVDAELLAQAAQEAGLGDDPRLRFAELEEIATVQRSSELERAVPRAEVEADVASLRAWYDAHTDEFTVPEQRSAEGVMFKRWADAEAALASLQRGDATLDSLGEVVHTQPQTRDDREFPGFHPVLFADDLDDGALLPVPVIVGQTLLVARVTHVTPQHTKSFDDPAVREAVVEAVRAPRLARARAARLAELAAQFPER